MGNESKTHWVDRVSDQVLRFIMLVMIFGSLIVNASDLGYTFKTVFFSTMLVAWVVFGFVSVVKWKRDRKMTEEKPR